MKNGSKPLFRRFFAAFALFLLVLLGADVPEARSAKGAVPPGGMEIPSKKPAAGDKKADREACPLCHGRGVVPCDRHKKAEIEKEAGTLRCSETIPCKACRGTFLMKCPRCDNPPPPEVEKAWKENVEWLAKMREIDAFLKKKKPVMHGESAHFVLTFDVSRLPIGRKGIGAHEGMHLYLKRLETLYEDVKKDLGAKDKDFLAKTHVMIWERQRDLVKTAHKYCHQDSNTKSYLIGAKPIFTIYYNKGFLHEEFELHQAVVHNVVHCLLSNVWDGMWPGNIKGGWLDAGYAHFYELKYFGNRGGVRNYCYLEGDVISNFKFGKWEPTVLLRVLRNDTPSFLSIAVKNTYTLTPEEHMFSWSYVDFLLKEHPDKFGAVCRLVKGRKPIAQVMKDALGWSPFQFEDEWKSYVKGNYKLKPKKGTGNTIPKRKWRR